MPSKPSVHAHGASELKSRHAVMREMWRELKSLGVRLRSARERAGLTQEEAAELIGLHAKHLQRIERGTANLTFATLYSCARAYRTSHVSLLTPAEADEPFTRLPAPSGAAPAPGEARPYVDSIPLVSLEAAAGAFGRSEEVRPEAWVATRGKTQPAPKLFVARVVGESMNRRIPSGSYCIFRELQGEPDAGTIVLAQHRRIEDPDHGGQYTVKAYERDGRTVRLEPQSTSRKYRAISLRSPEGLSIVAELVEVLR